MAARKRKIRTARSKAEEAKPLAERSTEAFELPRPQWNSGVIAAMAHGLERLEAALEREGHEPKHGSSRARSSNAQAGGDLLAGVRRARSHFASKAGQAKWEQPVPDTGRTDSPRPG
jgi:hypothetical protein